jgi:hypothetical protein
VQQIEEQLDILLRHLKAEELQVQYAMHLDTDNAHYHVVINRIHPLEKNQHQQHKCVNLGDGWILNALHRSAAEIEATQGWHPNPIRCLSIIDVLKQWKAILHTSARRMQTNFQ